MRTNVVKGLEAVMRRRGVLDAQASGSARQRRPEAVI